MRTLQVRNGESGTWMSKEDSVGVQKCVECESTRLTRYDSDRVVCMDCGFVVTINGADLNPEPSSSSKWRDTNYMDFSMKRLTPYNGGIRTIHNRYNIGGDSQLNGRLRNRLFEKWWKNARVSDATEKNLAIAFSEMTKVGEILSLPKCVLEKAATTYKMIVEKEYIRAGNIRTLSIATVYMACKQCDFHCTLNDVAIASNTSRRKIGRSYRFIVKELGGFIPPSKPKKYLSRFLDRLAVSEKTRTTIGKILNAADKINVLCGRNPMSIVAAATYIASLVTGEKKTQREIAEIAHVTEATIRNRYKELMKETLLVVTL